MTASSLPVAAHPTMPKVFVIYNEDGSEAGFGELSTVPMVPNVGQFAPLMLRITHKPDGLDAEPWDDLNTPARPA